MDRHCDVLKPEQAMVWQDEPQRDRQFEVEAARLLKSVRKPLLRSIRGLAERRGMGLITCGIGLTIGALNDRWFVLVRP